MGPSPHIFKGKLQEGKSRGYEGLGAWKKKEHETGMFFGEQGFF